jgi:hypothetical protein
LTLINLSYIKIFLILSFWLISTGTYGQQDEPITIPSDDPIVKASNRFVPRPKFFDLGFESFGNFKVNASSDLFGDSKARVAQNLIRQVKLKFPLVLRKKTNVFGGLGYRHEQFKFDQQSDPDYQLFERFEDKSLKRLSFSAYLKRTLEKSRFLFAFLNSSLNSDAPSIKKITDQLKLSFAFIYGKNLTPHKNIGGGVSFGYEFGQPVVFPVFQFKNDFSLHWGYEFLLPKSMQLRYSPSDKNHVYLAVELQGASYHLQDSVFAGYERLEFRRSSVRFTLTYQRELHDWLWLGLTAGYREPINIFLSEPGKKRTDALLTIDAQSALYYGINIFLVPPAKLYKKAKGSG